MLLQILAIAAGLAVSVHSAALSVPALQLLESLGLPSMSMNSIRKGEKIRQQDSPIYYIKLPPMAALGPSIAPFMAGIDDHRNSINDISNSAYEIDSVVSGGQQIVGFDDVGGSLGDYGYYDKTTKSPFHKIPVEFTNNGKPNQIYHWSRPTTSDDYYQFFKPRPTKTTTRPTTTTTTTPKPTTKKPVTIPEFVTSWPPEKFTTKKPWANFIKQFASNGKPTGLYVYKSKPVMKTYHKYKHPVFRHFNY